MWVVNASNEDFGEAESNNSNSDVLYVYIVIYIRLVNFQVMNIICV